MFMKTIWIFGDSYADPQQNIANIDSWTILLDKKYNVKNFALGGSGPEYSLEKIYSELEKVSAEEAKDIIVIFLISNLTRYNFTFLKPHRQSIVRYVTFDKRDERIDSSVIYRIKSLLDKKKINFIRDFFKYYHFNQHDEIHLLKILGAVKTLSNRVDKILCASCFDPIPEYVQLVDGNFYLFSHTQLFKLGKHNFKFEQDPRSNHIENWQHPVFFEQVSGWIDNNSLIDFDKIKGNQTD